MRKHDDLCAFFPTLPYLLNCTVSPEAVLAVERVIKDHDFRCPTGIVVQLGKEKCESKSAFVASAQRISEAGPVLRGGSIAEINRGVIDENLIAGTGNASGIAVPAPGDAETSVEIVQQLIDCLLV